MLKRWWIGALVVVSIVALRRPEGSSAAEIGAKMPIACIYFPGYHRDKHYDAWFGEGWNEWRLVDAAKPLFPGHRHLRPAKDWGYFDEADPKWMARQIDLAADHGIDVFIFDWYWYSGVKILHRPLEEGFLKAPNRGRMKYALMWANHAWLTFFPVPYQKDATVLLPMRHSAEDFDRVMQHCIETHFNQSSYWRIDGAAYFSIFSPEEFVQQLGGPEKTKQVLDKARKKVADAGLGKIHFAGFTGNPQSVPSLKQAGFESLTSYNVTSTMGLEPTERYEALMAHHEEMWRNMDTGQLPYAPVATIGWDCTPRWEKNVPWPPEMKKYPYMPVVVGNTPEKFGELVQRARVKAMTSKLRPPFVLLNAWNEWTEGSALLPEEKYGTQYLEEVKKALAGNDQ